MMKFVIIVRALLVGIAGLVSLYLGWVWGRDGVEGGLLAAVGIAPIFCLAVANAIVLVIHARVSRWMAAALWVIAGLTAIGLMIIGIGAVQDMMGTYCSGFFGTQTSCLSNSLVMLVIMAVAIPFVIIGAGLLALIGLITEIKLIRQHYRVVPK